MASNLFKFKELIKNKSIQILNNGKAKIFLNSSFFYIDEKTNLDTNETIYENFNKSLVVVINQLDDGHFILYFQKTLLIINQEQIHLINSLISSKPNIKFCFLSDCHDTFIQKISQNNNEKNDEKHILIDRNYIIKIDHQLEEEIQNFDNEIMFKNGLNNIFKTVIYSITCYLIKESYLKLDNKDDSNIPVITTFTETDFTEIRKVGTGSVWFAYLMFHIDKEEIFVIKQIYNQYEDGNKLFEREKNNYINISYPRIPKFYGTINCKKSLIIEFIDGQDLTNIKERFTLNDKCTIIFQLMMIINYLHSKGFVYRDLKPDNVIIDKNKRAYLIDFDRMHKITESLDPKEITVNFDSTFFNQDNNGVISYFDDIYSLYMMIYYILNEEYPDKEFKEMIINDDTLRQKKFPIYDIMINFYLSNYSSIEVSLIPDDPPVQYDLGNMHLTDEYNIKDINKSIYFISLAAKHNYPEALFSLGCFYFEGKYVKKDINKALDFFICAADNNHKEAQYNLGVFYSMDKYVELNINKSIHYYSLAANQNHPQAQHNLALIYYLGQYINRDIKKTIHYFTLAAEQNHPGAEFNLGAIYHSGKFVNKDVEKAIHYFSLAAEHNHPEAQFILGNFYYSGENLKQDIQKAIHYYSLAAKQNHIKAQHNIGCIYYTGQYVTKDIAKAIHYFSLAAKQGCMDSKFFLDSFYNSDNVARDMIKAMHYLSLATNQNQHLVQNGEYDMNNINKAIHYFVLAANKDCTEAQFILGNIYYSKLYVPQDIYKAIHYYKLAANKDFTEAQFILGNIYYSKQYVPQDIHNAIHYYSLAAKKNHQKALYNLGCIYYSGQCVLKNIQKAIDFFLLAADHGLKEAQHNLAAIYYNDQYVPQDIKKAIHYFSLAAKQGFTESQFTLGTIYISGHYVKRNINLATNYYSLASNQNHPNAQFILGSIYYLGIYVSKNLKKGQHYIELSSLNGNRQANFAHGFLLHKRKDIKNAIHYYLESSSFNNQYAKNNLGVIYKNGYGKEIKIDKSKAIEYFKEAIRKNDYLSKYNLAHLYIYDESFKQNINEAIGLLIESSNMFHYSIVLLCLFLIKKFGKDLIIIKNEIRKQTENKGNVLKLIISIIYTYDLLNKKSFDYVYELYSKMNFLYDIGLKPISSLSIKNETVNNSKYPNALNISSLFYEGFGIDL